MTEPAPQTTPGTPASAAPRPLALVTGASSGIGRATAVGLATDGFDVIVHYGGNREGAERTAELADEAGAATALLPIDLEGLDDAAGFWDAVTAVAAERFGARQLDALVSNAGVDLRRPFAEYMHAEVVRLFQVNAIAPLHILQGVAAGVRPGGSVVAISSVAATQPLATSLPYGATKAALDHLVRATAALVAEQGIRVNAVSPGAVDTPLQQPERIALLRERGIAASPEEIADVVRTLVSPATRWVTGQVIDATGRPLR
ncbi:SDR family oxidoreductase [Leucobacter allii]|uniref:SDR family oxidoreductase n=1 Tax=Leucobacter allii TaxID=2932247 RepID=A0ABY4FL16_9MICO|nr:SDR family oxidoreductase [Leucobacter allii]UOQ56964.1 SDR family oxidoreductase [Leucobacter allii]